MDLHMKRSFFTGRNSWGLRDYPWQRWELFWVAVLNFHIEWKILTIQPSPLVSKKSCSGEDPLQLQLSRLKVTRGVTLAAFLSFPIWELPIGFPSCVDLVSAHSLLKHEAWPWEAEELEFPQVPLVQCLWDPSLAGFRMLSRCAGTGSAVTSGPWPRWGVPHTPKPCHIILTREHFSLCPTLFPVKEIKCCLCLGIVMGRVDTLKNVNFFKPVPSNTNPPVTEARTGNSERCLQELGLPLLWGCAHCQKLKVLIPPALRAKSKEFQIKQISCKFWTSPSCACAPESKQCK